MANRIFDSLQLEITIFRNCILNNLEQRIKSVQNCLWNERKFHVESSCLFCEVANVKYPPCKLP